MLINLILDFLFQQTHESCVNSCPAVIIHTKDNYTCHVSTDLCYLRCLLTDKRHKHSRLTQHFPKWQHNSKNRNLKSLRIFFKYTIIFSPKTFKVQGLRIQAMLILFLICVRSIKICSYPSFAWSSLAINQFGFLLARSTVYCLPFTTSKHRVVSELKSSTATARLPAKTYIILI